MHQLKIQNPSISKTTQSNMICSTCRHFFKNCWQMRPTLLVTIPVVKAPCPLVSKSPALTSKSHKNPAVWKHWIFHPKTEAELEPSRIGTLRTVTEQRALPGRACGFVLRSDMNFTTSHCQKLHFPTHPGRHAKIILHSSIELLLAAADTNVNPPSSLCSRTRARVEQPRQSWINDSLFGL